MTDQPDIAVAVAGELLIEMLHSIDIADDTEGGLTGLCDELEVMPRAKLQIICLASLLALHAARDVLMENGIDVPPPNPNPREKP